MRGTIRYTVLCGSLILAVLSAGCRTGGGNITYAGEMVPAASAPQAEEEIIYLTGDDEVPDKPSEKRDSLINPEGKLWRNVFIHRKGIREFPGKWGVFRGT